CGSLYAFTQLPAQQVKPDEHAGLQPAPLDPPPEPLALLPLEPPLPFPSVDASLSSQASTSILRIGSRRRRRRRGPADRQATSKRRAWCPPICRRRGGARSPALGAPGGHPVAGRARTCNCLVNDACGGCGGTCAIVAGQVVLACNGC